MADRRRGRLLAAAAFLVPLAIYLATASSAVQFDDGAQFVLCARDGSAAHPPGFPLWVTAANLWLAATGSLPAVTAICAFVAATAAAAIALLYLAFAALLADPFAGVTRAARRQWAAFGAALATATGATVWQWSNSAEVYSLQLLAMALLLFGLARDNGTTSSWRVVTGIGIGIGLANHHVSMVLLLPFLPALTATRRGIPWQRAITSLLPALGVALAVAAGCYALLMLRAGGDEQFAFGQPDTLPRLWHHLSGGFFGDSLWREGIDYGGRASVLAMVVTRHFWLFAIPFAIGCAVAWRQARALFWSGLGYAALLFFLQFGRMHTPNMDAALLPALAALGVFTALGLARFGGRLLPLAIAIGLAAQVALNLPACNRRGYSAGDAILADLDASAPERSILLLTSWEMQTIALLARAEHNWRPDLALLSSSLKGTHKDLFARRQPALHAAVREEYEAFLAAIAAVDPNYVYTDYFTLSTAALRRTYAAMLQRVFAVAREESRPVLCDRATARFLLETEIVDQAQLTACGNLFAIDSRVEPRPFALAEGWLSHPFLQHDLCAIGALHDYRATAKQMAAYWKYRGNREMADAAERASNRLEAAWNDYIAGKPIPRK